MNSSDTLEPASPLPVLTLITYFAAILYGLVYFLAGFTLAMFLFRLFGLCNSKISKDTTLPTRMNKRSLKASAVGITCIITLPFATMVNVSNSYQIFAVSLTLLIPVALHIILTICQWLHQCCADLAKKGNHDASSQSSQYGSFTIDVHNHHRHGHRHHRECDDGCCCFCIGYDCDDCDSDKDGNNNCNRDDDKDDRDDDN